MNIIKSPLRLYASPKGVITRFLYLPGIKRISNVVRRVEELSKEDVDSGLEKLMKDFGSRHRDIEKTFLKHFHRVEEQYGKSLSHFSSQKKSLHHCRDFYLEN